MPSDTTVNTAKDGQESTSTDNPRSTAGDGLDGNAGQNGLHAYFLFHATLEQLEEVRARLHNHGDEDLEDDVEDITIELHQWEDTERDATEADILRLTREKLYGVFIDRRAADPADGMILLTEWAYEENCLQTRARLPPSQVILAACNLNTANMELIDFVDLPSGGMLEYDLNEHGPTDTYHL